MNSQAIAYSMSFEFTLNICCKFHVANSYQNIPLKTINVNLMAALKEESPNVVRIHHL